MTAFLAQAVCVGATFGSFTVFVDPLVAEFGSSRGVVSVGMGLMALMIGVMGPIWGRWVDRGEFRRILATGSAAMSVCLFAASWAPSLPLLGLLCVAIGTVAPLTGPLTGSSLVGKVFAEGRGRAVGIASMGPPAGTFLFAIVGGEVIVHSDWRTALRIFAFAAALLVPLVLYVIPKRVPAPPSDGTVAWTRSGLLRSRNFLSGACAMGIAAGLSTGWASQVAPFVSDLGHDLEAAAFVAAVGGGMGIVGTLVLGMLADRWSPRWLFFGVILLQAGGYGVYLLAPPYPVLLATAALFGICGGSFATLYTLLLTERFGTAGLGQALGVTNLFLLPFASLSPVLAGSLRDSSGSYALPIALLAVGMVVAASALLVPPRERVSP